MFSSGATSTLEYLAFLPLVAALAFTHYHDVNEEPARFDTIIIYWSCGHIVVSGLRVRIA